MHLGRRQCLLGCLTISASNDIKSLRLGRTMICLDVCKEVIFSLYLIMYRGMS